MVNAKIFVRARTTYISRERIALPLVFRPRFLSSLMAFLPICLPLVGLIAGFAQLSILSESAATIFVKGQNEPSGSRAAESKQPRIDFKVVRIYNGITKDGTWTAMYKMLGSNRHVVWKLTIPYDSAAHAEHVFQDVIKQADKIIRKTHGVNEGDQESSQRILGTFPVKASADHRFRLIWTSGSSYHEIDGDTLQDVLDLETYMDAVMSKDHHK